VNTLRSEIHQDAAGNISGFKILQSAPAEWPTIRDHRMGIGFYDLVNGRLARTHSEELDVSGAVTEVTELVGLKRPALILLNDGDLAYSKIRLDGESWKFALENLKNFDDSLARALVWGSAWDATRDGEVNPSDFINLVLGNVAAETQGTALLTLLRQLVTTTKLYTSEALRDETMRKVAARLLELAGNAAPGSDGQLLFTRFSTYFTTQDADIDKLQGLFDGSLVFEGLAIDQEMRWDLINGLVMGGRFGKAEIDAELERDNTANGAKQAMMATASLPTAADKRANWLNIINNSELSNTDINFGCMGLIRAHDTSLLEPLVDWYFDAAMDVWNSRTFKIAEYILRGAYPIYLANKALADRTREFAHRPEVAEKPALQRIIFENLDTVERALKAQAQSH
jgi:aminopeptidase N